MRLCVVTVRPCSIRTFLTACLWPNVREDESDGESELRPGGAGRWESGGRGEAGHGGNGNGSEMIPGRRSFLQRGFPNPASSLATAALSGLHAECQWDRSGGWSGGPVRWQSRRRQGLWRRGPRTGSQ